MVQRILRIVLALLIPLAVVEAWRVTPGREDGWRQMDFAVFYTAGRMFTSGTNPYVRANAEDVWKSAGGDPDDQPGVMDLLWGPFAGDENNPADRADHWLPVEVVPPGLTVMTPFSLLPAGLAWPAWNYVVLLLFVGQLYATVRLMRRPLWDASSLVAILFTILLEPLHIGLANGQPTVPTVSLLVLALYWATNHRQDWAGVAFAVATALKPQLAAPFVLLFAFQGKWRTVGVAAIVGVALTLIAVGPMTVRHPEWPHTWLAQVDQAEGAGNIDSARADNVGRDDLLNLALIGHLFTDNATVVNATTLTLWAVAVAALFWATRGRRDALGVTATFAVLVLLPMYHRYYDAGIVVLAAAWAVATLAKPRLEPGDVPGAVAPGWTAVNLDDRAARWAAAAVLAVSAVFLFPSEWLVARFREASDETQHRWWFNWVLEPHHAWELLAIVAALSAGLAVTRRRPGPTAGPLLASPVEPWWARHRVRLAVAALVPLAGLYGWWITPDHESYKECDFAMYYTASRTFLQGRDPYDRRTAFATWWDDDKNGDYDVLDAIMGPNPWDEDHPENYWLPINCVPPALIAFAPFAWMRVPHAFPTWNGVVTLLLAAEVWAVLRLMRVRLWSVPALCIVIAVAVIDPTHIGYANGQPSLPSVALTVIACRLAVINWQLTAGLCMAVATALKPQLAGPFVLLFAWQRKWKAVAAAAVVGGAMTLGAVVPLVLHDHGPHRLGWLRDWVGEVRYAEQPGQTNDPRRTNAGRHDMVHLQLLLHFFSDSPMRVNVATQVVVIGMGALLWKVGRGRQTNLLTIAAFTPLPLLFAYHRLYDCGILILPIGWAILHCVRGRSRWPARFVLLACSVYAVSQGEIQDHLIGDEDHLWARGRWWFDLFVEPHHTWGLLTVYASLIVALWRERIGTTVPVGAPDVDPSLPGVMSLGT
jgi:hypothetical protein